MDFSTSSRSSSSDNGRATLLSTPRRRRCALTRLLRAHFFPGWMDPLGELMVRERSLILHTRNARERGRESKAEQGSSRAAQAPPCLIAKTNLAVAQSVVRRDSRVFFPFPLLPSTALRASTLPHFWRRTKMRRAERRVSRPSYSRKCNSNRVSHLREEFSSPQGGYLMNKDTELAISKVNR